MRITKKAVWEFVKKRAFAAPRVHQAAGRCGGRMTTCGNAPSSRQGAAVPPDQTHIPYFPGETGLTLKMRRCSRFASKRNSVFESVSLSLSMTSWIAAQ